MEITKYHSFIAEQFAGIITDHHLVMEVQNDHSVELKNDNIGIELFTEYRVDDALGTVLRNKKNKASYDLSILPLKKGETDSFAFLTPEEDAQALSYGDPIKELIFIAALILKKFGSDVLRGDFSALE
ncbi:MAG TPA: hypothetical protein VGB50_13650 [Flavobacterium sp.]|jgi:hypothetical protein